MDSSVPFVGNSADDLHCLPAVYLMIVKYFEPRSKLNLSKISPLTGFEKDKGTWASKGLIWFTKRGYKVIHFSDFDYERFINDGGKYLIDEYGNETGSWQIKHSNIPLEQKRAKKILKSIVFDRRVIQPSVIKKMLDEGYLLRCLVNYKKLVHKKGYVGHAVVVKGYDKNNFYIHDPGLPPRPNLKIEIKHFMSSFQNEMDAIKYAN